MQRPVCESVGIDLGTTNSAMAYVDHQLIPRLVIDNTGRSHTPSAVYFDEAAILVGEEALIMAEIHPERVAQSTKLYLAEGWQMAWGGHGYTAESISAILLSHLIKQAESQIGTVKKGVLAVPAYFTEKRRRATQQAAEIAGLEVMAILNEPVAALLAYGLHTLPEEQIVLVYHLGGGTFDVTLVRVARGQITELSTKGNRQLGGNDWDQALTEYVAYGYEKSFGINLLTDPQWTQRLRRICERAKRKLSLTDSTTIAFDAFGEHYQTKITRGEFERMTASLLEMTRLTIELALNDAALSWGDVTRVVPVGGSTMMPMVRQMLQDVTGQIPDTRVHPMSSVALGTAIYAYSMETGQGPGSLLRIDRDEDPRPDYETPSLQFVTSHGVGIRVRDSQGHGWKNVVLIPGNTRVPSKVTKRFIAQSNRKAGDLKIEITQGDSDDIDLVESLGTATIGSTSDSLAGQPIDLTMEFDAQGRLHVEATCPDSGQSVATTLAVVGGLAPAQIEEQRATLEKVGAIRGNSRSVPPESPRGPGSATSPSSSPAGATASFGGDPPEPPPPTRGRGEYGDEEGQARDAVDCTVFAPPVVPLNHTFMVQVYVHGAEEAAAALALAQEFDAAAKRRGTKTLGTLIERGSKLIFELSLPGLSVDEPIQEVLWQGQVTSAEFEVSTNERSPRNVVGKLIVYQNAVPIGTIRFQITIENTNEPAESQTQGEAIRYQQAFISYASQDRSEVMRRVQMLAAVGIRVFQDILTLEPGEQWADRLFAEIDRSDVLFLFWSRAAKASQWVEREWKYGLEKKGDDFIHPIIVEGPPVEAPPPELAHLHFNDRLIPYLNP